MPVEIKCREDIIKLPDIASLRAVKKQWNVENDGRPLKDREDYVRLLLDFFDRKGPGVSSNQQVRHAERSRSLSRGTIPQSVMETMVHCGCCTALHTFDILKILLDSIFGYQTSSKIS
jgi:hypothetical protein